MATVDLQIMSDLHLETPHARPSYEAFDVDPYAAHLALLGDIGNVGDPRLFSFLEEQLRRSQVVFYLLGNHEPYGMTVTAARARIHRFREEMDRLRTSPGSSHQGRFVFPHRTRHDLAGEVTVLGCTLFSNILPEQRDSVGLFTSEFSSIEDWTIDDHCAAHHEDLQWLNDQVAHIARTEPERSIVVLTHHSPTASAAANDPRQLADAAQVRSSFVTDLADQTCRTCPQVCLWAFGNTHFNCDFSDPQTRKRVVANQKGYRRSELGSFDATKVVSVDIRGRRPEPRISGTDRTRRKKRSRGCVVS